MVRVSCISHPIKIVEDKVRVFHDHFNYFFSTNNHFQPCLRENHISLLKKIQLRARFYSSHSSTYKLVGLYLSEHPLLNSKIDPFSRKGKLKLSLNNIRENWNSKNFKKVDLLIDQILLDLPNIISKETVDYFDAVLRELLNTLKSKKGGLLIKQRIIYLTRLLASEFLRAGFRQRDVSGLNSIFDRLLSNIDDVSFDDSFYSPFPIPEKIMNLKGKDSFKLEVAHFFKNRTFTEQFEGLYNIFKEKENRQFVFRIDNLNVSARDTFKFSFNDVTFCEYGNLPFDFSQWEPHELKRFEEFGNVKNSILSIVPLNFSSYETAKIQAIYKIKDALGALNFKFGSGGIINDEEFYAFKEKGANFSWQDGKLNIVLRRNKKDSSIKPILSVLSDSVSSEIKDHLFLCDKVLFRAYNTKYFDDEILYYWRFIETFLAPVIKVGKNTNAVFNALKKIQTNLYCNQYKNKIRNSIINITSNSNESAINCTLNYLDKRGYVQKYIKSNTHSIDSIVSITNHYFINDLKSAHEGLTHKSNIDAFNFDFEKYYRELYEQRNIIMHQGEYCLETIVELKNIIPLWVKSIRNEYVKFVNSNSEIKSLEKVVELYIS